jgi:hypothetical protein
MEHDFYLGQTCEGEGLKFEIVSLEPLVALCLENSGWWIQFNRGLDPVKYPTWIVGQEYELTFGTQISRNFNFHSRLPWCSVYENGTINHYR